MFPLEPPRERDLKGFPHVRGDGPVDVRRPSPTRGDVHPRPERTGGLFFQPRQFFEQLSDRRRPREDRAQAGAPIIQEREMIRRNSLGS